jgi:anaerobic magnesium-protoporphyrin IX monomethyl ester cyclase
MSNILLISYDNGSYIPFFPINLAYLAHALRKAGHSCDIWLEDIHHGKEEVLTEILDQHHFDVVGLGFCAGYYQYQKAKKISMAINASKNRSKFNFVMGGHGPAGSPEFFLEKMGANSIVIGDGEGALCNIVEEGQRGIIQGAPQIDDEAPIPIYQELSWVINIYRLIRWPTSRREDFCFPILSSRGCKFHCSFCYRMREGFWERSIEAILDEIKWLHHHAGINHFQFADELLMSSERRTEKICEAILGLPFKIKWDCNGRLNYATSKLMSLMRQAGCEYVNYGIESLNQQVLNEMGKGLSTSQIYTGVEATLQAGLSPGLNLLWNLPLQTEADLFQEVDFLKKYDPCHELRTIRPVTPYPGCPLYQKAVKEGLVKDAEDFYENKHKNSDLISVDFMDIPIDEAHRMLMRANKQLYENYLIKRSITMVYDMNNLYLRGDTKFRGFRAV